MRIGAFQFDVQRGDVAANLSAVERGMREAAASGVELLLLPEMWTTSFGDADALSGWMRASDAALDKTRRLSEELGMAIAGSALGSNPRGLPFNRMRLFDRGELLFRYDKVHLFSPTGEQLAFGAGEQAPRTVEWRGWKLAAGICYDLRFPGLWRAAFLEQAELLLLSAQWPEERAEHWAALLRGRAVEHQSFFLAANRTGSESLGRRQSRLEFPGNSMLVSPHGKILAEGLGQSGLVVGEIEREQLRSLRRGLPVRKDERPV